MRRYFLSGFLATLVSFLVSSPAFAWTWIHDPPTNGSNVVWQNGAHGIQFSYGTILSVDTDLKNAIVSTNNDWYLATGHGITAVDGSSNIIEEGDYSTDPRCPNNSCMAFVQMFWSSSTKYFYQFYEGLNIYGRDWSTYQSGLAILRHEEGHIWGHCHTQVSGRLLYPSIPPNSNSITVDTDATNGVAAIYDGGTSTPELTTCYQGSGNG